jgi:hypothetical protein
MSGALYAAGCVQLREEADEHALSLPSTANDGKSGCRATSGTRGPNFELSRANVTHTSNCSLAVPSVSAHAAETDFALEVRGRRWRRPLRPEMLLA